MEGDLLTALHETVAGDNEWNPAARDARERPLWMLYEDQEDRKKKLADDQSKAQKKENVRARVLWGPCRWWAPGCAGDVCVAPAPCPPLRRWVGPLASVCWPGALGMCEPSG